MTSKVRSCEEIRDYRLSPRRTLSLVASGSIDVHPRFQASQSQKGPLDMAAFLHWTLFDIIGDLVFGESFGGLTSRSYNPWIWNIFDFIKLGRLKGFLGTQSPILRCLLPYIQFRKIAARQVAHYQNTAERVKKRLSKGATERPDFMSFILRNQGKGDELSFTEMLPNAASLVLAGSETTSTLLAGAVYLLARHQDEYRKVAAEVRNAFPTEADIDIRDVEKLPYLEAVLKECFRLYPPAPGGLDRIISNPAGSTVAGYWLPHGTKASVHQLATYTYKACFHQPQQFIPRRWLGDAEFHNDERDVVQPFSVGSRDCIGRNLAYMNMRLILSRVLHRYDIKLADEAQDWIAEQKIFTIWEKIPLMVLVTPAQVVPRAPDPDETEKQAGS